MAGRGKKKSIDIDRLQELCENGVTIHELCQSLGISPKLLYDRAKTNKKIENLLKKRLELAERNIVELAKTSLTEILQDKKHPQRATVAIFVLKTRAGWVEQKNEIDETKDKEITVRIIDA